MLDKVQNVVDQLKAVNSSVEKVNILAKYKNDQEIVKFFQYCYDDTKLYGVSAKSLTKAKIGFEPNYIAAFDSVLDFFSMCDALNDRKFTGNAALEQVLTFIDCNSKYSKLILTFFDRNLEIGMGVTQINRALGDVISVYEVALAATYDPAKEKKYNLEDYWIERKLDGIRVTTFIKYDKSRDEVSFSTLSRNGKPYLTLQKMTGELEQLYRNSPFFGTETVIDGECCIVDEDGKEDWNSIVSEAKRKDHVVEHPLYIMFDIMTADEFFGRRQSMNYSVRYATLKKFCSVDHKLNHIKVVFAVPYTKENFEKLQEKYVDTDKWEGFIFRKANVPFKAGRSTDLLKFKLFKDAEFQVLGVTTGKKYMLNENGVMEERDTVAALIIEYKGNKCQVGSGLSDFQRLIWFENPELIEGKWINVRYKQESKNQDGTVSLQFPVLKMVLDGKRDF